MGFKDTISQKYNTLHRDIERGVPAKTLRDYTNRMRWGADAPVTDETLFVDPQTIHWQISNTQAAAHKVRFVYRHSGQVIDGDWDRFREPVTETFKYKACVSHFTQGVSWEETGLYSYVMQRVKKYGVFDSCRTKQEVIARYEGLDRLFENVCRSGRLLTQAEMGIKTRREHGGIFCHIGHDGQFLRFLNGNHRFVIARLLKLPEIPVHIGAVHKQAVLDKVLVKHRH